MSILIDNIYSYGISELRREYTSNFISFTDLSESNGYVLNLKQRLKKIGPNRYVLENRSLSGIVLDSLYDIRNVLNKKQPEGFNPIITNFEGTAVYKINIDWELYNNIIVTKLSEPLYLTFMSMHSLNDVVDVVLMDNMNNVSRFGNFVSILNSPILLSDGIGFEEFSIMESNGSLLNTTIYITFKTKINSTGSLLTDDVTSVTIEPNKLFIKSFEYETPFVTITSNTGYCIACVITDNEILMYFDKLIKSGMFIYTSSGNKKLYIKLSDCIIFNISINNNIHSRNAILNNMNIFKTKYNI